MSKVMVLWSLSRLFSGDAFVDLPPLLFVVGLAPAALHHDVCLWVAPRRSESVHPAHDLSAASVRHLAKDDVHPIQPATEIYVHYVTLWSV